MYSKNFTNHNKTKCQLFVCKQIKVDSTQKKRMKIQEKGMGEVVSSRLIYSEMFYELFRRALTKIDM